MRDESLRWGLGMGAAAAILGTAALILGSLVEPVKRVTTAEAAALAIFIRGIFVLVTLGIALGLAYYAGLRAERARLSADAAEDAPAPGMSVSVQSQRSVAVLAGGLTMFCYWLITSLYMLVLPPSTQPPTAQVDLLSFAENRLLFGIIFVLFGLGLGGLGGRAPAAQLLLDRIVRSPLPAVAASVAAPPSQELAPQRSPAPAVGEPDAEPGPIAAEPERVMVDERATSPVDAGGTSSQSA